MCDSWKDFSVFLSDMGERPSGMTLDRVDNDEGYSKDNCRWASPKQQARNRRTTKWVEYKGEKKSLAEWCDILNLNYIRTLGRINNCKWSVDKAFSHKD